MTPELRSTFHRALRTLVPLLLGCAVLGGLAWYASGWLRQEDPRVATPRLALEALKAEMTKSLYFNGAARPWLLAQRADLLTAADRDEQSGRSRAFAQAVLDAKLFRQLDRQQRFDTLLLIGDPSQYRLLLEHLLDTKDFTLSYVDHTSVVFRRGGPEWSPAAIGAVRVAVAETSKRDQATVLALLGTKLIAVRRAEDGRALLEEAKALDPKVATAWSGLALDQMNRGNLSEALVAADRALAIDDDHLAALAIKTQCYFAMKRFAEAYTLSQQLIERLPDDPNILFKHAQIAHQAHAFQAEIKALEKLIAVAVANQRETTGYRLYLAQAYTAAGNGPKALENFQAVLADPALPVEQRDFARDSMERIKSRTGL